MAVRGIGIERDVGQHADLRRRVLDRLDRAADQIVGIERLARIVGAQARAACWGTRRCRGCRGRAPRAPAAPIRSTDQRETPGRVAIGSSTPSPSVMNSGQIRSAGVSTVSATSARLQAAARVRRRRRAGKAAWLIGRGCNAPSRPCKAANERRASSTAMTPSLFLEHRPDRWHSSETYSTWTGLPKLTSLRGMKGRDDDR